MTRIYRLSLHKAGSARTLYNYKIQRDITMKQRLSFFKIAPLAVAVAAASNVMAQDSDPIQLEEVLVTAQKREQSLQDVAISVTVMSGEKIIQQGFNDLQELSDFVPGLSVEQGDVTGTNLSIRGINNGGPNIALEQARRGVQ